MQLIMFAVVAAVIGYIVRSTLILKKKEQEQEAKRAKWRMYAAMKRERRKAARGR